jgi:hypothetical protein
MKRPHKYGAVRTRVPTEHQEQAAVIRWARMIEHQEPALRNLLAIPNGGARTAVTGARLRDEGVSPGVPDLFLAWPSPQGYHGLFIELKRTRGGAVSAVQRGWCDRLEAAGYCWVVAYGWIEARDSICAYLGREETR